MKGLLLFTLLLVAAPCAVRAQTILLGERVPELRTEEWLDDRQPAAAPTSYIEFFHSSNRTARPALDRLEALAGRSDGRLRIVVVVRERHEEVAPLLRPYLSERFGVLLDPEGRLFELFGVSYLPFGVLTDRRNRALWMGNTLQLNTEIIEQTIR